MRISRHSRRRWADLCAGSGTVAAIGGLYEAEGIYPDDNARITASGQRRAEVQRFEASLDLDTDADNLRLLRVYAEGIRDFGSGYFGGGVSDDAKGLLGSLKNDGFALDDEGNLVVPRSPTPKVELPLTGYVYLNRPEVLDGYVQRIDSNITTDPPAAISAAKDLVESTCKFVLEDYNDGPEPAYSTKDDLLALYKKAAEQLGLDANAVPDSARGSKAAKQALRSMTAGVQALAELRNELGTGHGRTSASAALQRHAKLASFQAQGIATFLLDTWHERRGE